MWCVFSVLIAMGTARAQAVQDGPDAYGSKNKFGLFAEYSNDSSHIFLGEAENVRLGAVGVQYERRLLATHYLVLSYAAEFRPVVLESIPTETLTITQVAPPSSMYPTETYTVPAQLTARCIAGTTTYSPPPVPIYYVSQIVTTCGRQTNYAQGMSPVGLRINLRLRHRLQPTISTLEGYLFSTKPLPIASAGSFNFAFEVGVGLEYYLAQKRSVRFEYQLHHYSNDFTADQNPGVDSGMFKLTYSLGR